MTVPQTPQPPAAAYLILAPLFRADYFLKPPTATGVELGVTGVDGVTTSWFVNEPAAASLRPYITSHPELTLTADRPYRSTAPASGDTPS